MNAVADAYEEYKICTQILERTLSWIEAGPAVINIDMMIYVRLDGKNVRPPPAFETMLKHRTLNYAQASMEALVDKLESNVEIAYEKFILAVGDSENSNQQQAALQSRVVQVKAKLKKGK